MTAEVVSPLRQKNIIHQVAITGLSCRIATAQNQLLDIQNFWQNLVDKQQINTDPINIENSLLLQLAKEALIDANISETFYTDQCISIIVNNCRVDHSDKDISQLIAALGLNNNNQNNHRFTKSFGQGLNIAVDQLQSKQVDAVL